MGDRLIMNKKELRRKSLFDLVIRGQLTQYDASRRLCLSYRQTKRCYQRYVRLGDEGLVHRARGKRSSRSFAPEVREHVLALYVDKYEGFGPTLAAEKLSTDDGIAIHAETLRLWLQQAGLWSKKRKRKSHRSRRARKARFGALLQLDGSIHQWFSGDDTYQCLMNLVDDATSKTLALLATGETTDAAFRLLRWWIELHGIPMAVYVDLKSLYVSPRALHCGDDELVEPEWLTHFSKACGRLGIELIKAYSPQAKGRVERSHAVYQDRFVKELKLQGVTTLHGANQVLQKGFIDQLNVKFMKRPQSDQDAHVPLLPEQDLNPILCWEYTRTVANDWVVRFNNQLLQIHKRNNRYIRPHQKISVCQLLDGTITLWAQDQPISYTFIAQRPEKVKTKPQRTTKTKSQIARENKHKTPWGQYNPGWLQTTKKHAAIAN